ncbi:hypothetical protein NPIL_597391 [Nephila pilipes]|uniref:Uncharacterized protein n=1 Tax=Nephila pilipes TaxID=299642 RepID=A0A8X6Q1S4_NEPPI|nr:hypothetical protein NPIL_597391 [Nephila pilipes]
MRDNDRTLEKDYGEKMLTPDPVSRNKNKKNRVACARMQLLACYEKTYFRFYAHFLAPRSGPKHPYCGNLGPYIIGVSSSNSMGTGFCRVSVPSYEIIS